MKFFSLICFFLLLSSCGSKKVKPVENPKYLELQASIATTTWLEKNFGIINDYETRLLTSRLKERLSSASKTLSRERDLELPDNWDIFVLNTMTANAFSTGSGVIFLTRGLIKETQTEAELASIISHEMAHQMLGHIQQAISNQGLSDQMPKFQFTLDHELAADQLGFIILERARYDIRYSLSALTTIYRAQNAKDSSVPEWLNDRSVELQRMIASAPGHLHRTQSSREYKKVRAKL